jgi:hypothetical protein
MPEHESGGAANDQLSGRKREARAARVDQDHPRGASTDVPVVARDDAAAASEPMAPETTLSTFGDTSARRATPPGRQRSGDPPGV